MQYHSHDPSITLSENYSQFLLVFSITDKLLIDIPMKCTFLNLKNNGSVNDPEC